MPVRTPPHAQLLESHTLPCTGTSGRSVTTTASGGNAQNACKVSGSVSTHFKHERLRIVVMVKKRERFSEIPRAKNAFVHGFLAPMMGAGRRTRCYNFSRLHAGAYAAIALRLRHLSWKSSHATGDHDYLWLIFAQNGSGQHCQKQGERFLQPPFHISYGLIPSGRDSVIVYQEMR